MSDYRLDRLNTRDFEHLVQALCKKFIAVGTTPFGDGPDGGREATFDGPMDFPSNTAPWSGYLVVQCKFRQRSTGDAESDTEWVTKQLNTELGKYDPIKTRAGKKHAARRIPEFYLFVTNAVLSGNAQTGGHDKCEEIFASHSTRLGLKGRTIWGFDEIRALLDNAPEIRQTYIGFILPDDILHAALKALAINEPNVEKIFSNYLQKELHADYSAKLESAGQHDLKRAIPLSRVFIDLPFSLRKDATRGEPNFDGGLIKSLVNEANTIIRHHDDPQKRTVTGAQGRFAIVGGPGQGKSTIGQFLCQAYRAALLNGSTRLDPECQIYVEEILTSIKENLGIEIQSMRFPFRIILNRFATDLSRNPSLTIFEHVRSKIQKLGGNGEIPVQLFNQWIANYPWIFVLDGLDEVPSSSNRAQVLEAIRHFLIEMATEKADIVVIATTRPQGYSEEFSASYFQHLYLPALSKEQALEYGAALIKINANGDQEKFEDSLRRLSSAASSPATMRLMASPLQVTIMTTLVERLGEPPKQRYKLFAEYYRTIYNRETSREGSHSELLRERNTDIDIIHYRTGLLLQAGSELEGTTDSSLPLPKFLSLVRSRLCDQGLSKEEVGRLTEEIKTSALDRLIFLVSPHDETVGFEIRSLQEFMAAEALAKGNTAQVLSRITEIAPISNWLNVFLFLVGCLCENDDDDLLNHTILLCADLNNVGIYPDYALVKWGARVALEILADGATRPAPRRESQLVRTALELLDHELFEEESKMAAVYHPRFEDIYREKITNLMINYGRRTALPAWKLLDALAMKDVEWAKELFLSNWGKISSNEKCSILDELSLNSSWHVNLATELIPQLSPGDAFSLLSNYDFSLDSGRQQAWPSWLRALVEIRDNGFSFHNDERSNFYAANLVNGTETSALAFELIPVKPLIFSEDLFLMPCSNPLWENFFSLIRFSANPCKKTLADAMRASRLDEGHQGTSLFWKLALVPWPLGVLLHHYVPEYPGTIGVDLEQLASLIEEGAFGDTPDWEKAEALSAKNGVKIDLKTFENLSYSKESLALGVPIGGFNSGSIGNVQFAIAALKEFYDSPFSKWLAQCASITLYRIFYRIRRTPIQNRSMDNSDADEKLNISVDDAILLIKKLSEEDFSFYVDAKLIYELMALTNKQEDIVKMLEFLSSGALVRIVGADSMNSFSTAIKDAMIQDKLSERALKWGLWGIRCGAQICFSKDILAMSEAYEHLTAFERALLRIGSEDIQRSECECLIENFSNDLNSDLAAENVGRLPAAIDKLEPEEAKQMLRLAAAKLSPELPLSQKYRRANFWKGLYLLLEERRSSLLMKQEVWKKLGLFPLPADQ